MMHNNDIANFSDKKTKWEIWHDENPAIWAYFEKYTLDVIASGKTKISHWLIINRIRWEVSIATTGSDFKISNNYIAFYARLWAEKYPQYASLFNTKKMAGEPNY